MVTVTNSTINTALVNQGTLVEQGSSTFAGTFSNAMGGTLRVQGGAGNAVLTVAAGFTNAGAIELTNAFPNGAYSAALTISAGTLTNTGSISTGTLAGAAAGGARTLTTQLDNQGSLTVNANGSTATTLS